MPPRYVEVFPDRSGSARSQSRKAAVVADVFLWSVLVCAVLGTALTTWSSGGVGRLHPADRRELQRQQHFEHVLSLHVDAVHTPREGADGTVAGAPRVPACAVCGSVLNAS